MDNKYTVGDIVKLNAGGPDMSVLRIEDNSSPSIKYYYKCQWFAGKKLESGMFPEANLIKVIPKADNNEG